METERQDGYQSKPESQGCILTLDLFKVSKFCTDSCDKPVSAKEVAEPISLLKNNMFGKCFSVSPIFFRIAVQVYQKRFTKKINT